jgi:hypothetical protein
MNIDKLRIVAVSLGSVLLLVSEVASAYIGPGAGLGVIGTLIAFVGAVLLAIVGFVWYPIKRLLKRKKQPAAGENAQSETQPEHETGESASP